MKRRSGEIQVFSISFLDVLSNALGAVLLILLYTMFQSESAARTAKSELAERDGKIASVIAELDRLAAELRRSKATTDEERKRADAAAKALASVSRILIDLKGPLKNVVFVFDRSGSMEVGFQGHKDFLNLWIQKLPFERFNVVLFSDDVTGWKSAFVAASDGSRTEATRFINAASAAGGTNTGEALRAAFAHSTVDTIVLMTDGAPSPQYGSVQDIENWVRNENSSRKVTVNCVAIGNYFNEEYGAFLQRLARDNGGQFIGR